MGCIVNGPGESKHADIGISLPGTGESPVAPVFIDGKKVPTLRGEHIAAEFQAMVEDLCRAPFRARDAASLRTRHEPAPPARGTHDLLGEDLRRHRHVAETGREHRPPLRLWRDRDPDLRGHRGLRRARWATPPTSSRRRCTSSRTAAARAHPAAGEHRRRVRAVITNGLTQDCRCKLFYDGPMFRYERPQKGRLRQFHQIGIELLGAAEPLADVEVIACGAHILRRARHAERARARAQHAGRQREPARLSRRAGRLPRRPQGRLSAGQPATGWSATRLRILDSKDPGRPRVVARRAAARTST